MMKPDIYDRVAAKRESRGQIAVEAAASDSKLDLLVAGLDHDSAPVRYGCAGILRLVSESYPEALYSRMEQIAGWLRRSNTFLKCDAVRILGNLVRVDTENRFEAMFAEYFAPIPGPALIPAATVIRAAADIALARPDLVPRIVAEVLKVEKAKYATAECRNIALGHAIQSFALYFDQIPDRRPVIALVRRQLRNRRPATRKKAESFFRKFDL